MALSRDDLMTLLRLVGHTREEEIDCEEFLARVAAFVEALEDGPLPPGSEALLQHLRVCPECLEELEALHEAWRAEP